MQDVVYRRLYNQQIAEPRLKSPGEVVAWLGAIQGQDYAGAKWSIGLRLPGSTDAGIEQTIADKHIFRTWVMRGTLHLVAAADVRWMVELVGPRIIRQSTTRYRQLEIDDSVVSYSNDVLLNALAGGNQLTRKELFAVLEAHGISTQGQRGIHLLQRASLEGLIVQGVAERNNPSFMRLDEALPDARSLPREEALAELALRYFTSRGPATLQDFAGWSGLLMADVRAGFEAIKNQLVEEVIDGKSYWGPPETVSPPEDLPLTYAPPGFDEYLLGYKDRDLVLDPQHVTKVVPGKNGVLYPTMVVGGRVIGIWKRTFKKGCVVITTAPFQPLSAAEWDAFSASVQPFGEFHQMPVEIIT